MEETDEIGENSEIVENLSEIDIEHLKHFIEVYETLPELWNPRLTSYKNRNCRKKAMQKRLPIYQNLKSKAHEVEVRKKINTLRTNYRKEVKKIITSRRSGSGEDEAYTPTSWVFNSLQFLGDSELPVDFNEPENVQETPESRGEPAPSTSQSSGNSSISSITPQPLIPRKKMKGPMIKQNELLSLACKYFEKPQDSEENDKFACLAKMWANKLKELEETQLLLAGKEINDVLFQASMNTLQMPNNMYSAGPNFNSQVISSPSYSATSSNAESNYMFSPGSSSNSQLTSPPLQTATVHENKTSSEQILYMFPSEKSEETTALYISNFTSI